jgi:V/A-type H+-transporting ATPase subunit I
MLFPEKMLRVKIEIEPEYGDIVLEKVGKLGYLHIDKTKTLLRNEAEASRVKILLKLVQKTMTALEVRSKRSGLSSVPDIEHFLDKSEEKLSTVEKKVDVLLLRIKEEKEERERFERAAEVKEILGTVIDTDSLSTGLKIIKMRIGIVTMETAELLRLALKEKKLFLLDRPMFEQTSAVAVFYEEEDEEDVNSAFVTLKVKEIFLDYFSQYSFDLQKQKEEQITLDIEKLANEQGPLLQNIESQLYALYTFEKAKSSLKEDEAGLILEGWIPKSVSKEFVKNIDHVKVTFLEVEGEAPVLLDTPLALKPFEKLISNFSYPRYGEVNPVIPFAFSFLLLFGIMFGDVGHGLVLALVGWLVKKQNTEYSDLGQVYFLSGISSIFFGFLYGSVFGVHDLLPHLLFTPIENIDATIIFSIAVGIGIITLSFFLYIVTAIKRKEFAMLFVGEGSLLWLLAYWFGIGILIKSLVQNLNIGYELMIFSLILLVIFVQMLWKAEDKAQTVIDFFLACMDTVTNTISFLRVGAFALAHGALFMAVFSIAKMISESYGESFFYWMLIIVGNVVIIVLEGVIVTIQTLRLEYYEFFKRFFKGGGTPYQPYNLSSKE